MPSISLHSNGVERGERVVLTPEKFAKRAFQDSGLPFGVALATVAVGGRVLVEFEDTPWHERRLRDAGLTWADTTDGRPPSPRRPWLSRWWLGARWGATSRADGIQETTGIRGEKPPLLEGEGSPLAGKAVIDIQVLADLEELHKTITEGMAALTGALDGLPEASEPGLIWHRAAAAIRRLRDA